MINLAEHESERQILLYRKTGNLIPQKTLIMYDSYIMNHTVYIFIHYVSVSVLYKLCICTVYIMNHTV